MTFKTYLKWCFIIAIAIIILMGLFNLYYYFFPAKTTYQQVQEYRHENYYDIISYDDYLPDYNGDYEVFTEEDVINAYQNGVNDGIEQTIEYFEYIED